MEEDICETRLCGRTEGKDYKAVDEARSIVPELIIQSTEHVRKELKTELPRGTVSVLLMPRNI